jgi:hypothetical protein
VTSARRRTAGALALALAMAVAGCGGGGGGGRSSSSKAAPAGGAAAALPPDFVGLVSEEAFSARGAARRALLKRQSAAGVRLLRQTFDWSLIETARGTYRLDDIDGFVSDAARAGIEVLPILFNAPGFYAEGGERAAGDPASPPRDPATMGAFARTLVARYGPDGSLWREHPDLPRRPIRAWQVWNEPNLPVYWNGKPDAAAYVRLLRVVGRALHDADPRAEVVTGGMPDSRLGIPFERYVRQLYAAGAKGAFDTLAIHPYAATDEGVVLAVRSARRLLTALGDPDVPIWVTEVGWASEGPASEVTVGAGAQATLIRRVFSRLAAQAEVLHVRGIVYFNWRDAAPYAGGKDFWGLHTGLLAIDGKPKPALAAYTAAARALQ